MFINQKKFKEIQEAAKNGNEKARMVLQAMKKFSPQADVDRLVEDYYKVEEVAPIQEQPIQQEVQPEPVQAEIVNDKQIDAVKDNFNPPQPEEPEPQVEQSVENVTPEETSQVENTGEVLDLTEILDSETEGLFDLLLIRNDEAVALLRLFLFWCFIKHLLFSSQHLSEQHIRCRLRCLSDEVCACL